MTPAQVWTQIRQQANETTPAYWSDSEILVHMSNAESIIAQKLGVIQDSTSFTTGDGTREYTLGATVGVIRRLTYDSVKLDNIGLDAIGDYEGEAYGGIDATGTPEYYYRWGDKVGFSPIPDEAKTVAVYHEAVPVMIDSTAATTWTIPAKYGQYVTSYALWQMFTKDQQLNEEAVLYNKQWTDGLAVVEHDSAQTKYGEPRQVKVIDGIFVD